MSETRGTVEGFQTKQDYNYRPNKSIVLQKDVKWEKGSGVVVGEQRSVVAEHF